MNEFQENREIKQAVPVVTHPVGDTEYKSIVHERRGVSGVAIAALVMAAIAVAVLVTMLIMNNQQRNMDDELALQRAQAAGSQQQPPQQVPAQSPQQSPAVIVTPSMPATTSAPAPSESRSATTPPARSNVEIELDITSKFVDDPDLRSYPIDVKVAGGIATLSGELPKETLKVQAERLARRVKGIESVINNITVQAQS